MSGNDYSDWLNELLDTLRLGDNIRIMGVSYGGWVASQYALYHPERLNRVVLIAPVFTVLPLSDEYILQMVMTLIPLRYLKSKMVYEVWADLAQMGEHGREIVEDRIDYYELSLKCFKFKQPVNPTVLSDSEIEHLGIPVLFLVGEHETVYNAHDAISRLNRVNSKIKTELITGTGHDLMFTHTEIVNKKILDFLKE
jgi:pimeloyl-ACP methyl ester carboxylesterase